MTFIARLDAAIKCNRLTNQHVATACNVKLRTVSKWRNGDASPRSSQLRNLCHLLKTTPNWLVLGDKNTMYFNIPQELATFLSEIKHLDRGARFHTLSDFHHFLATVTTSQITDKTSPFIIQPLFFLPDTHPELSQLTLGERIKLLKVNKKLNNKQIATACNVTEKTVYNWYTNKREPSADDLRTLSIVLESTPNWLMSGYEDLAEWAGMSQESIKAMLDSFEKIPPRILNRLIYHYRKVIYEIQGLN